MSATSGGAGVVRLINLYSQLAQAGLNQDGNKHRESIVITTTFTYSESHNGDMEARGKLVCRLQSEAGHGVEMGYYCLAQRK